MCVGGLFLPVTQGGSRLPRLCPGRSLRPEGWWLILHTGSLMVRIGKMRIRSLITAWPIMLASVLSSMSTPATAEGLVAQAYLSLPFDTGKPFYGLRGDIERHSGFIDDANPFSREPADFDLRFDGSESASLLINGVALDSVLGRYATDDEAADGRAKSRAEPDWYSVAGILVGVGIIVAIVAADDSRIEACSGANCPPEEKPEPAPAEADAVN